MPAPIQAPYNADEEPLPIMNGPTPNDGYQAGNIGMAIADVPGSTGTPAPTNDLARFAPPAGSTAPKTIRFPSRAEFDKMPRAQQAYWVEMNRIRKQAQAGQISAGDIQKHEARLNTELFNAQQNMTTPQIRSATNAETGTVVDFYMSPGQGPQPIVPKIINAQGGMYALINPTNAVPIVDKTTGKQLLGYAAEQPYPDENNTPKLGGEDGEKPPAEPPQGSITLKDGTIIPHGRAFMQGGVKYRNVNGVPQVIP